MSRIAKQIIKANDTIKHRIEDSFIVFSNGKNEIKVLFDSEMFDLIYDNSEYKVVAKSKNVPSILLGTTYANVRNAVCGLIKKFEKKVTFVGVGFKALQKDNYLELHLGYSHPIIFYNNPAVDVEVKKPNEMLMSSYDKAALGDYCAQMAKFREVEPYKGKGVIVEGEFILRKEGKKK